MELTSIAFLSISNYGRTFRPFPSAPHTSYTRPRRPTLMVSPTSPAPPLPHSTIFVAGATGRTGRRVVRELASSPTPTPTTPLTIRAGARRLDKCAALFADGAPGDASAAQIVPTAWTGDEEELRAAVKGATAVVCATGAAPGAAPWEYLAVDWRQTGRLVAAAVEAKVRHFVLVSSLGVDGTFPAALLNLLWGVLVWKKFGEETVVRSGMRFTIIRPGGMERPTDDFKKTHNIIMSEAGSLGLGLVSRLQVAEVVTEALRYPEVSGNKIVELIARDDAPLRSAEELFKTIAARR